MCTPPAAQALLVRNSSETHQRCETTPESGDCLASGFVLQREGSERAPIAGGSIQTCPKVLSVGGIEVLGVPELGRSICFPH